MKLCIRRTASSRRVSFTMEGWHAANVLHTNAEKPAERVANVAAAALSQNSAW